MVSGFDLSHKIAIGIVGSWTFDDARAELVKKSKYQFCKMVLVLPR